MVKFRCNDPATFFCSDHQIKILDENKKLFYYHPNSIGSITFNLPVGIYYTDNSLQQKPFVPYEKFVKPEKFIDPREFKILVGNNPHKATINLRDKTILFDKKIASHKYRPCLQFILGHEIYHTCVGGSLFDKAGNMIFDAEKACDDFSKNYMLSHGWNPTQIKIASALLLNDKDRVQCIHNNTITKNFRR